MMLLSILLAATLTIWDYPARQPEHERLRRQFVVAMREGDTATMEETCRKGVKLLPDDPTWHYNLACSLAYFPKRTDEALNELESAIDLGFRDDAHIAKDTDLKRLETLPRFKELVEYAKEQKTRRIISGPMATVDATGIFGESITLGAQNLKWSFDFGCFDARLKLLPSTIKGNTGDLYVNRDGGHSPNGPHALASFKARNPGITEIRFDEDGRKRGMDKSVPNTLYPYPVFGNCSMAYTHPKNWRSVPRLLTTSHATRLLAMQKMYLSNQIWVFPSNVDTAPVGTNGDVFASITPYWLVSAGRSWSDIPLLDAALLASRSLNVQVKHEIVRRGLLAPTIMTLMRKSFGTVNSEEEYLSSRAHPTAIPPSLINTNRLAQAASALTLATLPPLAVISVSDWKPNGEKPVHPELIYGLPFAWSFIIRAKEPTRRFVIKAKGAAEYRFVKTHGRGVDVEIKELTKDTAEVTLKVAGLSPTSRVDIAVFGRNPGTGWGAPSYVSISKTDPSAPYSDPILTYLE